nr:hypothetical protein [Clostridia bacterium]
IPVEFFTSDGKAVTSMTDAKHLTFEFDAKDVIKDTALIVPKCCEDIITAVTLDGKAMDFTDGKIFDEAYTKYLIPELTVGTHRFEIEKNGPFSEYDRIVFEGDFDADIKTDGKQGDVIRSYYNITVHIPTEAKIAVSARRGTLSTARSWAEQGQPFYSGGVTYSVKVNVKEAGDYRLVLPKVRDVVDLKVNGNTAAHTVKPPYSIPVTLNAGENALDITVYNSIANELDYYLEESGLLGGGRIIRV